MASAFGFTNCDHKYRVAVDPAKGHHLVIDKAVEEASHAYDQALLTMIEQWDSYDLDGNYVRFLRKQCELPHYLRV